MNTRFHAVFINLYDLNCEQQIRNQLYTNPKLKTLYTLLHCSFACTFMHAEEVKFNVNVNITTDIAGVWSSAHVSFQTLFCSAYLPYVLF